MKPYRKTEINQSNKRDLGYTIMEVTYLNILREYLELEFSEFLGDSFNLERVIDDFVLITFLVGNDFIH